MAERARAGIRVRCRQGGPAPCLDDMCHFTDETLCGLTVGGHEDADVCIHGYVPGTCPEGCAEDDDVHDPHDAMFGADFDDDGRYVGG